MSAFEVPICHRTIGPGAEGTSATLVRHCIGSECALWVAEVTVDGKKGLAAEWASWEQRTHTTYVTENRSEMASAPRTCEAIAAPTPQRRSRNDTL